MGTAALAVSLALLSLPAAAEPPPQGELVKTIRVLTHNIYGRHEDDCEARHRAIADHVLKANPPYDIVAFQEHWSVPHDHWVSCDPGALTKAMEADGRYKGAGHSVQHKPATDDVLQVAGGDSVFTLHKIVDQHDGKWVNGKELPLSGYVLAKIEVAPGVTIDFWDSHLEAMADGCDGDCRWEQATDLGGILEIMSGVADKGETPSPVLVVGDFNTGGPMTRGQKPPYAGNAGYDNVMDALRNPRDLWLELGTGRGYTIDCQLNSIEKCDDLERIDYMLLPEDRHILNPATEYVLVPKSISVVRWTTPDNKPVSDHYGLDATFEVRRRPKAAPPANAPARLDKVKARVQAAEGVPAWDGR